MFWKRRKLRWLIDPSRVMLGSVIGESKRNLSRSHVRVKYRRESEARFVPLVAFARRCHELIAGGRSLGIEHLLVAPIVKQRHAEFFDRLTDWGPAMRCACASPPRRERSREQTLSP